MKAVWVLVSLALPAMGSIFRSQQHYPQMDSLIVQPLEYIDQQQRYQNQYNQGYQQEQQQYQQQNYQQEQYQRKQKPHHHSSSSSESNSHSQETRERTDTSYQNSHEQVPVQHQQKWNSPLYGNVKKQHMKTQYGDAISWRGVKIAVGPNSQVTKKSIEKIFNEAYKTINHLSEEQKQKYHQAYVVAEQNNNEETSLNATELLKKHEYPVEEHTIQTDDGYQLTLFRIPPKQRTRDVQQRPVVFLMHDLLGSADDWLLMGPGKSLAYLLADAGYDVWLGNTRGNKYSRQHVSKHPALNAFWHFSIDEIALHDLPAMIDYALKTSNQQQMYYVGHGQGTTAFFALAATRPSYNDKIIMMYALSPMVYMSNVRSPLLRMIAPNSQFYERLHHLLGHGEFKPAKELVHTVGGAMCENEIGCKHICSNVNFVMSGVNVDNLETDLVPVIMKHLPAGASTKQIKHYGQNVASNEFRRYDHGAQINQEVYGSSLPPRYNMQQVTTPVALFYSEQDWLAHPKDVERLNQELPNVKDYYRVPQDNFSHMDFQFSQIAPEAVYSRLIESIEKNSY